MANMYTWYLYNIRQYMSRLINVQVDIYIYYKHQYLKHIFVSRGHCLYTVGADSDFIEEIPWGIWRSIEVRFITTSETFETSNREFLPENLSQPPTSFPPCPPRIPNTQWLGDIGFGTLFDTRAQEAFVHTSVFRRTRGKGPKFPVGFFFWYVFVGLKWTIFRLGLHVWGGFRWVSWFLRHTHTHIFAILVHLKVGLKLRISRLAKRCWFLHCIFASCFVSLH